LVLLRQRSDPANVSSQIPHWTKCELSASRASERVRQIPSY
jgi:hypothetical protein